MHRSSASPLKPLADTTSSLRAASNSIKPATKMRRERRPRSTAAASSVTAHISAASRRTSNQRPPSSHTHARHSIGGLADARRRPHTSAAASAHRQPTRQTGGFAIWDDKPEPRPGLVKRQSSNKLLAELQGMGAKLADGMAKLEALSNTPPLPDDYDDHDVDGPYPFLSASAPMGRRASDRFDVNPSRGSGTGAQAARELRRRSARHSIGGESVPAALHHRHHPHPHHRPRIPHPRDVVAAHMRLGDVNNSVHSVNEIMSKLQNLFSAQDTESRVRRRAATTIQNCYRRHACSSRYDVFRQAVGKWRARHARPFIQAFDRFTDLADRVAGWSSASTAARERRLTVDVFHGWRQHAQRNAPIAKARAEQAALLLKQNRALQLRGMLHDWMAVAIGANSRKAISARYQERRNRCRVRLEERAVAWSISTGTRVKPVTNAQIVQELHREIVAEVRPRARRAFLRPWWELWHLRHYLPYKEKLSRAQQLLWRTTLTKVFRAWTTYTRVRILEVTRVSDVPRPRHQLALIQNGRRVEVMRRAILMGPPLRSWYRYTRKRTLAVKRYNQLCMRLKRRFMSAWHVKAAQLRRLRASVVERWQDVGRRLMSVPFKRWFVWASRRRTLHRNRNMMVRAYLRRKDRQLAAKMFRQWRNQTMYGHTDMKRSSVELVEALSHHRRTSRLMKEALEESKKALAEAKLSMKHAVQERETVYGMLSKVEEDGVMLKMALHNAQQELVMMTTVADTLIDMHPASVRGLEDETIQIKDRGLAALARYVRNKREAEEEVGILTASIEEEAKKPPTPKASATGAKETGITARVLKEAIAKTKAADPVDDRTAGMLERLQSSLDMLVAVLGLKAVPKSGSPTPKHADGEAGGGGGGGTDGGDGSATPSATKPSTPTAASTSSSGTSGDKLPMLENEHARLSVARQLLAHVFHDRDLSLALMVDLEALGVVEPRHLASFLTGLPSGPQLAPGMQLSMTTWGDFLEDVSHKFPHHPKFETATERIQARESVRRKSSVTQDKRGGIYG